MGTFPYQNNKDDVIISDYGLHSGLTQERDKERDKGSVGAQNQNLGLRDNFPRAINLGNQQNMGSAPSAGSQAGPTGATTSGGAILLSYGAALAPQIQINNINNLNLLNTNMKKKLNHEAYQAYYNTSSANNCANNVGVLGGLGGINLNIQSSPIAGGHADKNSGPKSSQQAAEQNVYG